MNLVEPAHAIVFRGAKAAAAGELGGLGWVGLEFGVGTMPLPPPAQSMRHRPVRTMPSVGLGFI